MSDSGDDDSREDEEEIAPKRFGLTFDPPAILLEYMEMKTGKLFHRRIGMKRLQATANPARIAEMLRKKNIPLLDEDKVSFEQIVSLVTKLQEAVRKKAKHRDVDSVRAEVEANEEANIAAKVEAESESKEDADQDPMERPIEKEDVQEGNVEAENAAEAEPLADVKAEAKPAPTRTLVDEQDMDEMNLNTLTTEELNLYKERMDDTFLKNQKKPGDKDYVYNVEVEFPEGDQDCGWDSSGGEEEKSESEYSDNG
eukprot:TRINITY_DN76703_c0_g1_i1.p1 TRINITY_DN76703_c0_g1~~TRINITY_DN76703_c0_g1_i1.p1  ORF type:complete len:255 (-),score=69.38 TRINITY_DN76703_c0_g1_i1:66-830(-)